MHADPCYCGSQLVCRGLGEVWNGISEGGKLGVNAIRLTLGLLTPQINEENGQERPEAYV